MPIVFVHGVNNRKEDADYGDRQKRTHRFLTDILAPRLGLGLEQAKVLTFFPYWGSHGAKFRWQQASLPLGSEAVETLSLNANEGSTSGDLELWIGEARFQHGPGAISFGQVSRAKGFVEAIDLIWDTASAVAGPANDYRDVVEAYTASLTYAEADPAPTWAMKAQSLTNEEFVRKLLEESEPHRPSQKSEAYETLSLSDWSQSIKEAISRLGSVPSDATTALAVRLGRKALHDKASRFLGDIFIYLSERGTADNPGPIIQEVLKGLQDAAAAKQSGDDKLIVIGHSLGGIIVYDLLTHFKPDLKFDFFTTIGSQVALFEEMSLYRSSRAGNPANPPHDRLKPPAEFGKWLNVYDTNDVFSFRVEGVFDGPEDYRFDTGYGLLEAHGGYFARPSFYRRLAARLSA